MGPTLQSLPDSFIASSSGALDRFFESNMALRRGRASDSERRSDKLSRYGRVPEESIEGSDR